MDEDREERAGTGGSKGGSPDAPPGGPAGAFDMAKKAIICLQLGGSVS